MRITREEAARLTLRPTQLPVKEGWDGKALTVFVTGQPRNPLNSSHGHWSKHARWAKGWRERTASAVLRAHFIHGWPQDWAPDEPKAVMFTIYSWGRFDDDAYGPVTKPCRDGLRDVGVIHDDGPRAGHRFTYENVVSRKVSAAHGIAITIRLAAKP